MNARLPAKRGAGKALASRGVFLRLCTALFATSLIVAGGALASFGGSARQQPPIGASGPSVEAIPATVPGVGSQSETAAKATPDGPPTAADAAVLTGRATPTGAPSPAVAAAPITSPPRVVTAPSYDARQVLHLSRDVVLPSGRTFAQCAALAGEEWLFAAHDYWVAGTNTWVVETHIGDAGLFFHELTGTFSVRNVDRAGC